MNYETVIIEKKNGIAQIIMNRPKVKNALNIPLIREIIAAMKECEKDDSIKVIFLRGAGTDFCAGGDLEMFLKALEGKVEEFSELITLGCEFEDLIDGMSKPVIAAVHGHAIAGGLIFAYFCDLIIATEDATFGDAHARWGLVPGLNEPQRLARKIGVERAKQIFLTSDLITAKEAKEMGLVYKIYPAGKLDEGIKEIGDKFLKLSTLSIAGIKKQLASVMRTDWHTMLEIDRLAISGGPGVTAGTFTPDAMERLRSFVEKK